MKYKRLLSVILSILLLAAVIPLGTFTASAEVVSGTCGTNLTWQYDTTTYTLTISGTGAMSDYSSSSYNSTSVTTAPWRSYYKNMKTVVIGSGVTRVGDYAFYGCKGLTSITIPNSVTSIGGSAFFKCTGLTSITIPDSVTSIDDHAFSGCEGLTSVTIPDSVTSIGDCAFYNCTGLTSITIPDSVTSIGDYAFGGCTRLISVTIGNGVTEIGNGAFSGCTGLTSITIPDSVTSIGRNAFSDCTGLTSVTIGNSVESIGEYAFSGCTGLTSVTIPDSVTSIGDSAFDGCRGLKSVTIGNGVTSIGEYAFYYCKGLTSVTIPDSVTSIGRYAFSGCTRLTSVHYHGTAQQWSKISIGSDNSPLTTAARTYCTFDKWFVRTAPTCTETGVEYGVCTICGNEATRNIEVLGHSFTNYISDGNATCTADGTKTAKCDRCDETNTIVDTDSKLGHDYTNTIDDKYLKSAADCTHGSVYYKSCSRCGEKSSETFESDIYLPCGGNSVFVIKDNTLYIHGTGDTDNYKTQGSVPWYDYADSITEIVIDEEITKIGNYAFYCLENLNSIKSKNNNLDFGKYTINDSNSDIMVFSENGGSLEAYCTKNGINYIDPTITPELETVTDNSITVKALRGYEYSKDGATWQKSGKFTGLSPASEYAIYARYAATADIFDTVGTPLICTTLKHTVAAPSAPDYQAHTDNSITIIPNELYEYSLDGKNWQKSSEFAGLLKNTIYRFYQRVAETETEYASTPSAALIIAIPDKPVILEAGYDSILVKLVDGFEYCLDDFVWQDSNNFDKLIDNEEYFVYQRLKTINGEKVYGITSDYIAATTNNTIAHTHTLGEWLYNEQNHWQICADCGEKFDEAAHTPGDWITDIEPTTETAGHKHIECTICGCVLEEEDIPQLPAYTPGDINGDDAVNNKDLTRLFQYLSDWEVEVNEAALDVNGDGSVNNKDLTRLFQYLSDWDVEIF